MTSSSWPSTYRASYWLDQDADVSATLKRAEAYVEAGVDGIFIPGASDPSELRQLTSNIPAPVDVLVVAQLSLAELADLGVRRVSTGSLPYRAAIDAAVTSRRRFATARCRQRRPHIRRCKGG